jgi:hypothetical protein
MSIVQEPKCFVDPGAKRDRSSLGKDLGAEAVSLQK